MLALIAMALVIYWATERFGEDAGAIVFSIIGLILIVIFCKAWSDDSKAYANRVKYWKNQK